MPDLLSSLTHVVPKTAPLETGPTQTSISESVSRDPDQRHLPAFPVPTLTYIAFLGGLKAPFLSSAKAATMWGEVMHLCPSPTKWKPLEKDHIYSTLTVQHLVWCLQRPPDT